MSFINKQY